MGGGLQQQTGLSGGNSCSAVDKSGSASSAAACGARSHNCAAQLSVKGHALNGHGSNGHTNGVNGHVNVNGVNTVNNISDRHRDPQQHAQDVILSGAAALQRLAATIDASFSRAVAMIEGRAEGARVIVVGIGKSGHLARKMSATLSSTGTASFFMHGTEALHGDLGGAQVCIRQTTARASVRERESKLVFVLRACVRSPVPPLLNASLDLSPP